MPSFGAEPKGAIVEDNQEQANGLAAVLAQHRPRLLRFFISRTGDAAEAEDVVQEIWLHIDRAAGAPVANPLAYLHRVGMNIVLDRVRERRRRERREKDWTDCVVDSSGGEAVDDAPSPFAVAEGQQRMQALAAAIERLPPGAARVFRRHKLDGLSHAEIAAEFGISRSAVEKHVALALRQLRAALE